MNSYFIVFLGAGVGGALRHAANVAALRLLGTGGSWGTLIVNVSGSLIIGLLAGFFALKTDPGQAWRLFLTTGILGGYTTFSAFALERFVPLRALHAFAPIRPLVLVLRI